jgi:hypothetical protein
LDNEQLKSEVKILRANIVCYYDQAKHLRLLDDKKDVIDAQLNRTAGSLIIVTGDQHIPNDERRMQLMMDLSEVNDEIEATKGTVRLVERFFRSLSDQDLRLMRDYAKGKMTIVELAEKYDYSKDGCLRRIKRLMFRFIRNHEKVSTKCG